MGESELIKAMRQAVEASPQNGALRRHLAELLLADGQAAEAVQEYRKALDLSPRDSQTKLGLAEAYARLGKGEVALAVLDDLFRSGAAPAAGYLLAARLYKETGSTEEAKKAYDEAVARDPGLADPQLEKQIKGEAAADAQKAGGGKLPEREMVFVVAEGEPGDLPIEVERPPVTFRDVGGMEKLKEEIRMKIIYPTSHPDLFKAYGKTAGGGILMYGPPGCGKTFLARATAGEVNARFIPVGLHQVLDMYLGQSEQNLHRIFQAARQQAPCVLFFDEVDALGANRADMRFTSLRQVINQFLSELDGVDTSNEGVLILAATNMPWYVDPALRRPGRFDRVLFVPPPDLPARDAILRILLADKPATAIDFSRLARDTNGFSGADLRGLVDSSVERKLKEAMQRGAPSPLATSDLLAVLKTARPTTQEWFETARNYAIYSNEGGIYDDILDYLKLPKNR